MERLKTRSQFQAVLAGRIVARTSHFALHVLETDAGQLASTPGREAAMTTPTPLLFPACPAAAWVGALLPKRWAKHAATRNAIRRQIYQVSRALEPVLGAQILVVRLRATFDRKRFTSASSQALKQAVRAELEQLFRRIADAGTRQPA